MEDKVAALERSVDVDSEVPPEEVKDCSDGEGDLMDENDWIDEMAHKDIDTFGTKYAEEAKVGDSG